MGSFATTCFASAPAGHELDSLQQQLESMNVDIHTKQSQKSTASHHNQAHQQPATAPTAHLDHFRVTLYLRLIPRHLIPKHLFTIDPHSGYNLRKCTDRTIQFLQLLEELWEAADFCEEVVLEALVRSVSGRQQRWGGGEGELTMADLEQARGMVCAGVAGAWSPACLDAYFATYVRLD